MFIIKNINYGLVASKTRQLGRLYSSPRTVSKRLYQSVADFYAGKSVFVTGSTGLLGKIIVEKLLYSCSDIDKVYVLIRAENEEKAKQRLRNITDRPIFNRLKEKHPQSINKIVPIVGDLIAPQLGITSKDEDILRKNVSVVIHSGASVQFDEALGPIYRTNYEGTKKILSLCKQITNLEAFVHVSTLFVKFEADILEEKVYPRMTTDEEVQRFLEKYGDATVNMENEDLRKVLKAAPNTYTLAKELAENCIAENHDSIPTAIIRPPGVTSTINEPIPGYVDGGTGMTFLIVSVAKGFYRVINGKKNAYINLSPVDYTANLSIVAATRCKSSKGLVVYNNCATMTNPLTLKEMAVIICRESRRMKFNTVPYPTAIIVESKLLLRILAFFIDTIHDAIADTILRLRGKKPRYLRQRRKFYEIRDMMSPYMCIIKPSKSDNTTALASSLSEPDRKEFPFDVKDIDWKKYVSLHLHGVQKFISETRARKASQAN